MYACGGKIWLLIFGILINSLFYLIPHPSKTIPQVINYEHPRQQHAKRLAMHRPQPLQTTRPLSKNSTKNTFLKHPNSEFAELLEESDKQNYREVSTGDKVTGTLREIGDAAAFIDFGGRSEASIDIQELRDESGELKYKTGDTIEAFVASTDGEIRLAFSLRVSSRQLLRQAHQNDMPIAGKVTGFNTGGLVVNYRRPSRILSHVANRHGILRRSRFVRGADPQLQNC